MDKSTTFRRSLRHRAAQVLIAAGLAILGLAGPAGATPISIELERWSGANGTMADRILDLSGILSNSRVTNGTFAASFNVAPDMNIILLNSYSFTARTESVLRFDADCGCTRVDRYFREVFSSRTGANIPDPMLAVGSTVVHADQNYFRYGEEFITRGGPELIGDNGNGNDYRYDLFLETNSYLFGSAPLTFQLDAAMLADLNEDGKLDFRIGGEYNFWVDSFVFNADIEPIPEPGPVALLLIGLCGLIAARRLRVRTS